MKSIKPETKRQRFADACQESPTHAETEPIYLGWESRLEITVA